jgi:hypothetical protein
MRGLVAGQQRGDLLAHVRLPQAGHAARIVESGVRRDPGSTPAIGRSPPCA